jgi:hypothetical protein
VRVARAASGDVSGFVFMLQLFLVISAHNVQQKARKKSAEASMLEAIIITAVVLTVLGLSRAWTARLRAARERTMKLFLAGGLLAVTRDDTAADASDA